MFPGKISPSILKRGVYVLLAYPAAAIAVSGAWPDLFRRRAAGRAVLAAACAGPQIKEEPEEVIETRTYDIALTADGIVATYEMGPDGNPVSVVYDYNGNVKGTANE